ncbi:hypothetical protein ACIQWA_17050 [Kitasatospora sp. NPDC098652]|uniref:hypothetical protein n=1 Tax=Kitasatospora sp. NPDC098652 TaxID=3364095 RepID=UPI0038227EEA
MPSPNTPYVNLPDLLDEIEDGSIDVVDFGRLWAPRLVWIAELWQSLALAPQRPIGSILLWLPDGEGQKRPGRYGRAAAPVRILDGQHRCLALAAGCGIRPAWFTDRQWDRLGGKGLQVSVVLESTRRVHIGPYRRRRHPQIPLRELLYSDTATRQQLITDSGVGPNEVNKYFSALTEMQHRLLNTRILLEWLSGTAKQAAEVYRIRGRHASTIVMTDGEIETTMVALVSPGVRAEIFDPAVDEAARMGFSSAVTPTGLNEVVQFELPPEARHKGVVDADPAVVRAACERGVRACTETLAYLAQHGMSGSDFVCMPSSVRVLMKLFARFPHAAEDDFAWRWLARALAANRYRGAPKLARADSAVIASSDSYEQATSLLSDALNGTGRRLAPDGLHRRGLGGFGPGAALMALALSGPGHPLVRDLARPEVTTPDPSMRLVRLWDPDPPVETLGNYILATEATSRVLRGAHGWTPAAAEELQCPRTALDAQFIPQPLGREGRPTVQKWIKERDQKLLSLINSFLEAAV